MNSDHTRWCWEFRFKYDQQITSLYSLYIISQITHSRITFLQRFRSQSLATITKIPVLKENYISRYRAWSSRVLLLV